MGKQRLVTINVLYTECIINLTNILLFIDFNVTKVTVFELYTLNGDHNLTWC